MPSASGVTTSTMLLTRAFGAYLRRPARRLAPVLVIATGGAVANPEDGRDRFAMTSRGFG